jgi:hypothetical protein
MDFFSHSTFPDKFPVIALGPRPLTRPSPAFKSAQIVNKKQLTDPVEHAILDESSPHLTTEKNMQPPSDVPEQRFKVSKNLSEQIAGYLRVQIIRGELAPGERILEAKLAETMEVSRGPIREALRSLEKTRLIELTPRRGARVTEMSPVDIESR